MPEDPLSPPRSSGHSTFSRKSSIFLKKSRPSLPTVESTVEEDEREPYANASLTSLASSNGDSTQDPRRSLSLRSHRSQSSASIHVHKGRSPSLALAPTFTSPSPKKSHRLSRSISAGFSSSQSPQKLHEEAPRQPKDSPQQPARHRIYTAPAPPPKTAAHMLAMSRRPSEAHSTFSGLGIAAPTPAPLPHTAAPQSANGFSPFSIYNHINETTNKRMATMEYMRKVHEGQVFFFSTISYTSSQLSSLPSLHPSRLGRRASNYLLLGTSLPPLLELHSTNPIDYLKALSTLLSEFDTYCSLSSSESGVASLARGRMGQMLKSGMRNVKGRRTSSAAESLMSDPASTNSSATNLSSITDAMPLPPVSNAGHDFQYLQLPNLPFDPDFSTSFATLTDVLMDAYSGLLALLPSPDACPPGLAEAFAKADKQLRKVMMSAMVNEFGENTRKEARAEVAGIGRLVLSGLM